MKRRMTPRTWMMGAGAGALLLVGGIAATPFEDWNEPEDPLPTTEPELSIEEVLQIATTEHPEGTALELELENEGRFVYGVEFSDGFEVEMDANTGEIIETEQEDGAEDDEAGEALRVPILSVAEAREIAVNGGGDTDVLGIELESKADRLIYSVELSNGAEVEIDADTGEILEVQQDDEETEAEGEE